MDDNIFYLTYDREDALFLLKQYVDTAISEGISLRFEIERTKDDKPNRLKMKVGERMWTPPIQENYPDPTRVDYSRLNDDVVLCDTCRASMFRWQQADHVCPYPDDRNYSLGTE